MSHLYRADGMLEILSGDKPISKIFPFLIEIGLMYYLTKLVETIVPRRSDDHDDDAVCPGT